MKIEMLNLGWMTAPAGLWRQGDEEPERPLRLPVPAYLIETDSERILIDTGLHPDAVTDPEARYGEGTALGHFGLEQEQGLAEQVDLGTVTRLVLTHLHFDHAGGLALIPKSVPIVLQRAEWEAAHDRAGVERNFFQPADYADAPSGLTLLDGDHDLLGDGSIELLSTPGHTSGHQSVRIGDLVLGADVALFAAGLDDLRFPAFGADQDAQVRSAERLRELRDAGLTIQPGHDPDVLVPGPVTA
ncbi:MAG TPA: N-acyl homoserine lactonase family protein [Solirubrobacterales bacterium]|jgi:glyoxylase-like metal-dependent hydrolase (beta-lactamase superfamily II)|nr:N-acyl homoserine lactonase family protein [Solirubrobacterales bacterium]